MAEEQREYKFRAAHLLRRVFKQFGYTACCVGWRNVRSGDGGRAHTEECRQRIIQQMIDSGDPSYLRQLQQWTESLSLYFDSKAEPLNTSMLTLKLVIINMQSQQVRQMVPVKSLEEDEMIRLILKMMKVFEIQDSLVAHSRQWRNWKRYRNYYKNGWRI